MKGLPAAAAATLVACLFAPSAGAVETLPPSGVIDLAKDADAVLSGAAAGDRTGWSAARTGDVNGDGVPDMAIGAPLADPAGRTDAGAVYVVFGARPLAPKTALGTLGGAGFVIQGATPGDVAGTALAGAGDVNGDGRADLLVGAPHASDKGPDGNAAAYVVFGKADAAPADLGTLGNGGIEIRGAASGDDTGAAVAGLGDVNGDGRPDVAIGVPRAGNGDAGAAYVVFGTAAPGPLDPPSGRDGGRGARGPPRPLPRPPGRARAPPHRHRPPG